MPFVEFTDFPELLQQQNGKRLVYLDNAATTFKPLVVLDAERDFYTTTYGPVHRSTYTLAERATGAYEQARATVAHFLNAQENEIIFTSGTTASLNMVALGWAAHAIKPGEEILLSELEHHSNLVPWQLLAHSKGIRLKFIPVDENGCLIYDDLSTLIGERTRLISLVHASHVTGGYTDFEPIISRARSVGARVCIDAAQSVAHVPLDVQVLGCDFLAFSGHKVFGPTGVGVLFVRGELHKELHPVFVGGGQIFQADYDSSTFVAMPRLLEAGTPPVAQAIGLSAALTYSKNIGYGQLRAHESRLCARFIDACDALKGVRIIGDKAALRNSGFLVSFALQGIHPHDFAAYADSQGVCVRAGVFCAQPFARKLGADAFIRASFAPYTSLEDIDMLIACIQACL